MKCALATAAGIDGVEFANEYDNSFDDSIRPWDVKQLARAWKIYDRALSPLELANEMLVLTYPELRREQQTRQTLTFARYCEAFKRLSALCVAAGTTFIQSDLNGSTGNAKVLRLRDALPDWSNQELTALFERTVFLEKAAGVVQLQGFLKPWAAMWFDEQIKNGWPVKEAVQYVQGDDATSLAPSRDEFAAWLAQLNPNAFRLLVEHGAPTLLRFGDPSGYSLPQKRILLHALEKFDAFDLARIGDAPHANVRLFACQELEPLLCELLGNPKYKPHYKLLLDYALAGNCRACAAPALTIALAPHHDNTAAALNAFPGISHPYEHWEKVVRLAAICLTATFGTTEEQEQLKRLLEDPTITNDSQLNINVRKVLGESAPDSPSDALNESAELDSTDKSHNDVTPWLHNTERPEATAALQDHQNMYSAHREAIARGEMPAAFRAVYELLSTHFLSTLSPSPSISFLGLWRLGDLGNAYQAGLPLLWRHDHPPNDLTWYSLEHAHQHQPKLLTQDPARAFDVAMAYHCEEARPGPLPNWVTEFYAQHRATLRDHARMGEPATLLRLRAPTGESTLHEDICARLLDHFFDATKMTFNEAEHLHTWLLSARGEPIQKRVRTFARANERNGIEATRHFWLHLWLQLETSTAAIDWFFDASADDNQRKLLYRIVELMSSYLALPNGLLARGLSPEAYTQMILALYRVQPIIGSPPNTEDLEHNAREYNVFYVKWVFENHFCHCATDNNIESNFEQLRTALTQLGCAHNEIERHMRWLHDQRRGAVADARVQTLANGAQIRAFLQTIELPPSTMEELFDILNRRLNEIAHDACNHDFDYRHLGARNWDETAWQHWIADQLRLRSNGLYNVGRERHTHADKRIDIDASVANLERLPIEIKPCDKGYSAKALQDCIGDQLIGQYHM